MKKKTLFLTGAVLLSMTLVSCSQDTDATMEQERSEVLSSQSVSDLTLQLKEYDSRFIYDTSSAGNAPVSEVKLAEGATRSTFSVAMSSPDVLQLSVMKDGKTVDERKVLLR